jgi:hypothetical protein
MSKTRRRYNERDYYDGDYDSRQQYKNKSKERRYERALRIKSVDDLTFEEGLDPVLDFDNMTDDELLELKDANIQLSK